MTQTDPLRRPPRVSPGAVRVVSYLAALGMGVLVVLSLFPRDVFTTLTLPDSRYAGDLADHVAGQRAFIEDAWHWPLLRTTLLDWPGGLNIAMTDGNPLAALPLKLLHSLLPAGFSAVLLWLALAYVLQPMAAVFALRSAGEIRLVPAIAVAVFALSMPAFVYRHPHSALSSHFILLLALGAYFRALHGHRGGRLLPLVLLPASLLIHPYLAFMTFAVLLAAPVSLLLRGDRRWLPAAVVVAAAVALTVLAAVVLGYQAASPGIGFGQTSMNLLAPFYPVESGFFGGGLAVIDATGSQYEGYNYLGCGLLTLLVCAVVAWLFGSSGVLRRHLGLLLACLALTALAVSNVVYLGHHRLLDLGPAPQLFEQLRASGRLFWPVAYVLLIGAVAMVARLLPGRVAMALLLVTAALQYGDASDLRWRMHRDLRATVVLPIDAARLDRLLDTARNLTILPSFGCGANATTPEFMQLLLASTRHRVAANTMYVARFARIPDCRDAEAALRPLAAGELRVFLPIEAAAGPAAVPGNQRYCRMLSTVAVCTLPADGLAGLSADGLAGLPAVRPPVLQLGQLVSTAVGGDTAILGPGWYQTEPGGVWSLDRNAILTFGVAASTDVTLQVVASGYTGVMGRPQRVLVFAGGTQVAAWAIPNQVPATLRATIPRAALAPGPVVLRLAVAAPARPSNFGIPSDTRQLGVFLTSVKLIPASH